MKEGTETGLFVDGRWLQPQSRSAVFDKYTGETISEVGNATAQNVEAALQGASRKSVSPLTPGERARILESVADWLAENAAEVEADYVAETGFTIADAQGERARAERIYRLSAQEAIRIAGEEVPLAAAPGSQNRLAFTIRVPVGVVAAIAPFNAPLSTVAHKIGPAIAAGNTVVLKPAEATPLSAINIVRAFEAAGLPGGYLQLLCGSGREIGEHLLGDSRIRYYTFTGSTAVGRHISSLAGLARTQLELGSNSASIVNHDADVDAVAALVGRAGFRKAGQVCTSVQRLLVHRSRLTDLKDALATTVAGLTTGDPREESTQVGPMIARKEAERAADWIARSSASTVVGGAASGAVLSPTLLVDPARESEVLTQEMFAPVVSLVPIDSVDEGIDLVNSGPYGLQTGVFTQDVDVAFSAARRLQVGGVIINDSSSYHADEMPYGGVKESGHGQEGPRYSVADMTDPRIIVLNLKK